MIGCFHLRGSEEWSLCQHAQQSALLHHTQGCDNFKQGTRTNRMLWGRSHSTNCLKCLKSIALFELIATAATAVMHGLVSSWFNCSAFLLAPSAADWSNGNVLLTKQGVHGAWKNSCSSPNLSETRTLQAAQIRQIEESLVHLICVGHVWIPLISPRLKTFTIYNKSNLVGKSMGLGSPSFDISTPLDRSAKLHDSQRVHAGLVYLPTHQDLYTTIGSCVACSPIFVHRAFCNLHPDSDANFKI